MWQVLQETDGADRTDYIVIETSGVVSDPSGIVAALERRFGKMTRARLDGVALLVDADVFAHQIHGCADGHVAAVVVGAAGTSDGSGDAMEAWERASWARGAGGSRGRTCVQKALTSSRSQSTV